MPSFVLHCGVEGDGSVVEENESKKDEKELTVLLGLGRKPVSIFQFHKFFSTLQHINSPKNPPPQNTHQKSPHPQGKGPT